MDIAMFSRAAPGSLVPISGLDPIHGRWHHFAFVPDPLPKEPPALSVRTYLAVADARAALGALDSTAAQLPNPSLLRRPSLQTEAQSTSALEGTYAPLEEVLTADQERPGTADLREVLNYVRVADSAFRAVGEGRALTVGLLGGLQSELVSGTKSETVSSGDVRDGQVVVGRRRGAEPGEASVRASRFVPSPPGLDLRANLGDLLEWMSTPRPDAFDPVVATAMAHYQFETLHPFNDGNGRLGRLLVVVQFLKLGVLTEPTLTVSPWFEARRTEYYDKLLGVSTQGNWDEFIEFFAQGVGASARRTREQMLKLVKVQAELKERVRQSSLRADSAQALVDFAVGNPSFTVRDVERDLGLSYGRVNSLVGQLVSIGVLKPLGPEDAYRRRFYAPEVIRVLVGA